METYHVETQLNYLAPSVETSLYRNGKVFTHRDSKGNDTAFQGAAMDTKNIAIKNGRVGDSLVKLQLEKTGFELVRSPLLNSELSFFDQQQVVHHYYPECEDIVRQATGATDVFAFDHNVRSAHNPDKKNLIKEEQQIQQPIHYVHGDYTLVSAPQRVIDLARPPRINDTLRIILNGSQSLLTSDFVSQIVDSNKRFAIINVWRNIDSSPVLSNPLALCDGQSMSKDDLVVFEIHYDDRIGENYFAKYSPSHQWWYYPQMTRDEVILIKQWDSMGELNDLDIQQTKANKGTKNATCKFSLHSAFNDPTTPADAPDRQSIEVRCIVLFDT